MEDNYAGDPSSYQDAAVDHNGVLHVAFKDGTVDGRASLMKYENDEWVLINQAGFSSEGFFGTDYLSLVFDEENRPVVAYRDLNDDSKPSVMRFNGSSWEYLGAQGLTPGSVSYVSLAVTSEGELFLAFREAGLADKLSVMTFDGANWQYVGEEGFTTWDSSTAYIDIEANSEDEIFVAFQEEIYDDAASVMTFNGDNWEYVGDSAFSGGSGSFQCLAMDSGDNLYVGYKDNANGGGCSVMKYDGSAWTQVGLPSFSPGSVSYVDIAVDGLDRPVVSFRDWNSGSRTSVMRFEDDGWVYMGDAGFSSSSANHQSLATNEFGHLFVAYEVGDVEVHRFVVMGCNDPFACNFNIEATDDDGSCVTIETYEIVGFTTPQAGTAETYTYTETLGSSYEWVVENGTIIDGQGTSTITVEWGDVGSGSVTVVETNEVDCESAPVVLEVEVPVGIIELEDLDAQVLLSSLDNQLYLKTNSTNSIQYSIYTSSGALILEGQFFQSKNLDVAHLSAGIYVVQLVVDDRRFEQKIVIE